VTPSEALQDIRGYALAGRIEISPHARGSMRKRGAVFADVRHALATATACRAEPRDRWRVDSVDCEGDSLTVVVVLEGGVVVVTVF